MSLSKNAPYLLNTYLLRTKKFDKCPRRLNEIIYMYGMQTVSIAIFTSGVYKKMRAEEARLSENNQGMENVKQQHFIQEDKVT